MNKKHFEYKLKLESVSSEEPNSLDIQFSNHDNIFDIIERIKGKNIFPNAADATEFAIGLKMFTEVVLRNRQAELFKELQPAIQSFMAKLKKS